MEAVWVAGCSGYETTGVIHLLKGCGVSVRLFSPGERLRAGDTLILCFSSAPWLGWWRYLKITQWVAYRYDIQLIVMCPDEVHWVGISWYYMWQKYSGSERRTLLLCCIHLSRSLQQAVQCGLSEEILALYRECIRQFFLEKAVQTLRIHPAGESDRTKSILPA